MSERLTKLRDDIRTRKLDVLIVTNLLNIRYLSGFTGSHAALVVSDDGDWLLTDSRYEEQASQECPSVALEIVEYEWVTGVQGLIKKLKARRVGFEDQDITHHTWNSLKSGLPSVQLIPSSGDIERLRMVKDAGEILLIREAARIVDLAYEHITKTINVGMEEREIALEIDCFMRKCGADKQGFDSIVAAGYRSALPHAKPTDRTVQADDLILLDYGAVVQGYNADITRTFTLGEIDDRRQEVYDVVLEAQARAISAIRPGAVGGNIDAVARDYIASRGYGDYFGHGLGHGLGLAVHDSRTLARRSEIVMETGMVTTVEPGIYIPGWGGIRIEDDVLVTESGHEVLTRSPRVLSLP